jgi:(E)-4-hydroxy-3-methyl-but-2-enyl pyrophosphate reductase
MRQTANSMWTNNLIRCPRGWCAGFAAAGLLLICAAARAVTPADADAIFADYHKAFYFTNASGGYYHATTEGGKTFFWDRAEQLEMILDAYERTTNTAYLGIFTNVFNGFVADHGRTWEKNDFNDDIMWMVIACARAHQFTGNPVFRELARTNFDLCFARAWSTNLGGGLWWKTANQSKNACVNGPGAIAAYLLYQIGGDTNDLAKSRRMFEWERAHLFDSETGQVFDNLNTNGWIGDKAFIWTLSLPPAVLVSQARVGSLAPRGTSGERVRERGGSQKPRIPRCVIARLLRTKQAQYIRRLESPSSPRPSPPLFVEEREANHRLGSFGQGRCQDERAIDLAYAACNYFSEHAPQTPIYLLGEIIHNPEVNDQIQNMGIQIISAKPSADELDRLQPGDAVIIPAFGTEVSTRKKLETKGCVLVDTTCGDVMSVWKRVRQYSKEHVTSIIHGKAKHEETKATTSQARAYGSGHYLVVFNLAETDYVCNYILHGGDKDEFLKKFEGAYSAGFDPDLHLQAVGVANQTTMLRGETEEVQRRFKAAMEKRYGTGTSASISVSSTRFAAPRRTGRTPCKSCWSSR